VRCCDGTWNNPDELSKGCPCTDECREGRDGLAPKDDAEVIQLLYNQSGSDPAVTARSRRRVRLSRNVRDCYRFIVENYQAGDELYFFRFQPWRVHRAQHDRADL
jgi:hypothetical protein